MATREELQTAIAALRQGLDTLSIEVSAAIARLEAKIAAGADFTAEITEISNATNVIQAGIDNVKTKGV